METKIKLNGITQNISHQMLDGNKLEVNHKGKSYQAVIKQNENGEILFTLGAKNYKVYASETDNNKIQVTYKSKNWIVEENNPDNFLTTASGVEGSEDFDKLRSPFPGKVIKIMVEEGQEVTKGETLMVIEAMKLETPLLAKEDVIVEKIMVADGENINADALLMKLEMIRD